METVLQTTGFTIPENGKPDPVTKRITDSLEDRWHRAAGQEDATGSKTLRPRMSETFPTRVCW